jgi:hypothetical protein
LHFTPGVADDKRRGGLGTAASGAAPVVIKTIPFQATAAARQPHRCSLIAHIPAPRPRRRARHAHVRSADAGGVSGGWKQGARPEQSVWVLSKFIQGTTPRHQYRKLSRRRRVPVMHEFDVAEYPGDCCTPAGNFTSGNVRVLYSSDSAPGPCFQRPLGVCATGRQTLIFRRRKAPKSSSLLLLPGQSVHAHNAAMTANHPESEENEGSGGYPRE